MATAITANVIRTGIIRGRRLGVSRAAGSGAQTRKSVAAGVRLSRLDEALAGRADTDLDALRGRGGILAILEVLTEHADYFDAGGPG